MKVEMKKYHPVASIVDKNENLVGMLLHETNGKTIMPKKSDITFPVGIHEFEEMVKII